MKKSCYRVTVWASLLVLSAGCNLLPWRKDASAVTPAPVATAEVERAATRPTAYRVPPRTQGELRGIVTYLASDGLEGRGIDTPGIESAAEYIRNKFVAAGLAPVPGLGSYFHEFEHTTVSGIAAGTSLSSGEEKYALGKDYTVLSSSAEGTFSGQVVFAGYGIASEKYDDFAGIDVKGRVCLVLRFEPQDEMGNSRLAKEGYSVHAHLRSKFKACADHGAAAVILVNPPGHKPGGDVLLPFARSYQEGPASIPVLQVTQKVAEAWVKRAGGTSLAEMEQKIDSTGRPASEALKDVSVSGKVGLDRTTRKLHNVCAYVPGSGSLASEYVVVGAHYDHLGMGGPGSLYQGGKAIHHGADDNASGTAAMIALAEQVAHDPGLALRPRSWMAEEARRSILFVAFTAEESGLIGSSQFVQHPPVPLESVAAMLNMDMVGRVKNEMLYIGGAGTAGPFDAFVKRADEDSPLEFKEFGRGGFGPSDHMSFAAKKVPVLFLFSGMHADYHRPSDTADKINYEGLAQVVSVARELTLDLATMPKSEYLASADSANPHMMGVGSTGGGTGSRASLGVIPDYGTDISKGGVRITGTSPGTPAAAAGLKDGDVIVAFGDKKIDNLYDLTDALSAAKPGDKVKIKFLREGKEVAAEVTLAERRG